MFGWLKRRILRSQIEKVLRRWNREGKLELLKGIFGSKKALAALLGIVTIVLRDLLGLDEAMVDMVIKILMTYIGGQAVVDVALVAMKQKK